MGVNPPLLPGWESIITAVPSKAVLSLKRSDIQNIYLTASTAWALRNQNGYRL